MSIVSLFVPRKSVLDEWRRCPRCTAELERDPGRVRCPACGLVVHANPAPTASAIVVGDGGRVLLAKRKHEPGAGLWDIVGGFMEEGEAPLETLRREASEEMGVEIEPEEFVGGFADRYGDGGPWTINFYWTARIGPGQQPRAADDVEELRWFEAEALPSSGEFAFANSVEALRAWRERRRK